MAETQLIAPCGMNCAVCLAHLRKEHKCPGCRGEDTGKPSTRKNCIIKNCPTVKTNQSGFCYECSQYPCQRLGRLDKRYRAKYSMSMIENLEFIKTSGLTAFLRQENLRWLCPKCGGVVCVHNRLCSQCGQRPN
jgi:hypothetical protein